MARSEQPTLELPRTAAEFPVARTGRTPDGLRFTPFDDRGMFVSTVEAKAVGRLAILGAGATTISQVLSIGVQVIATVTLARLLTPADFGLLTMVTTFSLLFVNFGTNGFTEAVLQREEIDDALASNLFWVSVGAGTILTIAFAAAGPLMARFYGSPRVALIAAVMSVTILTTSTSVLHQALLMRGMGFAIVSANNVLAGIASVVTSILFARAGWGYWSLVAGAIAQPLSQSIGVWAMCRWVPSRPRRGPATREMVRFATHVYGRFSFNYFARNTDNLLVGWRFNAQALGLYKKAYDLFALSAVIQSLTSVAVSALSRLRKDADQYKKYLLGALSVAAFLGMAFGGALTLAGRDLIRILLGPRWQETGWIFTFFGPGIGAMFLYGTHSWIHLSIGRPDRWLRWGVIEFVFTALLFFVGLPWGPAGIATASSAALWILTIPSLAYAGQPIGLGVRPMIAVVWRYAAAAVVAGGVTAVALGVPSAIPASSTLVAFGRVVQTSAVFVVLYVGAVTALHGSLAPIRQVTDLLQIVVRKTKPASAASESAALGSAMTSTD